MTFNIAIRTYDVCALPISYVCIEKYPNIGAGEELAWLLFMQSTHTRC